VHFDVRDLIDAQHAVVVEIGSLDPPLSTVTSPYSAAVRPKISPPCSCAIIVSGLTEMPVSIADVTRRKSTLPLSSTSASTTVAMKLPNDG
jgi:hypothetical protein